MREDLRRIAHAGLTFNAPLSEERARGLVGFLSPSPGSRVVDLGCGWGELLQRILLAHPATTGTGIDTDPDALERGRKLAGARGLQDRIDFVEAEAASFEANGDIVVCVGSAHAFGDSEAALSALRGRLKPRGALLYGDGFWAIEPDAVARRAIGELPSFDALLSVAVAAGFKIDRAERSSLEEWDAFEASWRSGLEASSDPDAALLAAERKQEYEAGYRGALGFAWLVLTSGSPPV